MMRASVMAVVVMTLGAGCGGEAGVNVGRVEQAERASNGETVNGISMNGQGLNGISMNGTVFNGTVFNGTVFNGTVFNGISMNGGALSGVLSDGTPLSGSGMVGAMFAGELSGGGTVWLRIDGVDLSNADLPLYTVSYLSGSDWLPACGTEGSSPVPAMAVAGVWDGTGRRNASDATRFTFACRTASIGKCLRLGYEPWRSANVGGQPVSLAPYIDACVRMIRADYCGTGESWTVNGRTIDLWDGVGVQNPTTSWTFEAEWTPDGARCVSSTRVVWTSRGTPSCLAALAAVPNCGSAAHFDQGALLMNRYETQLVQP